MPSLSIIIIILVYLILLFGLGIWGDRNRNSKWVNNSWVYSLSLAVYCSAWTYYGSVGVAATEGISFLTTYLGPVIALPLWILITKRVIIVSKQHQVASLADFISLRYGKNRSLGALVTIICVVAIVPYMSLQLKAVSETFDILSNNGDNGTYLSDSTYYIALILAVFVTFFGTRFTDASRHRSGLMFTVAVESILKLIIFLIVGFYATYFLFDGMSDIYNRISGLENFESLVTFSNTDSGINWYFMIALSFFAIFLLPRQFQASVIENTSLSHLKKASWLFPLYLLAFNIFVIFIAWAGKLLLSPDLNPDYYTLFIPLDQGNFILGLLVFLGGLSSIISMVVVSALALSTMISNNLIIPYGLLNRFNSKSTESNTKTILILRRISIFFLIMGAYFFYKNFNQQLTLFSIGLIAFVIIAQLGPSFFIGLYWNRGSALGAKIGMISGSLITLYTLALPVFIKSISGEAAFLVEGPGGIAWLSPYNLFGVTMMSPVVHAFFCSMLVNVFCYLIFSVIRKGNYRERNYAEQIVNASSYSDLEENAFVWKGEAYVSDLKEALIRFLGEQRTERALDIFYRKYPIDPKEQRADARLVDFSEKLLTGSLGAASARLVIGKVVKERPVTLPDVLKILEENKETTITNKKLELQSYQLEKLTNNLKQANEKLREQDAQKDGFLDTVAHELKTPTASIMAAAEVLSDSDDMPVELKKQFMQNIMQDSERLSVLINNILDLEKLTSGRTAINLDAKSLDSTIIEAMEGVALLAKNKGVKLSMDDLGYIEVPHDSERMIQVFTNLLGNSIKFVEENQGEIHIEIDQNDDEVFVAVTDNGRGIPQEDLDLIFDKFYQAKNQNLRKPAGSGMGLAISKHIVESHGGKIYAKNNKEKGASIQVILKKEGYEKNIDR